MFELETVFLWAAHVVAQAWAFTKVGTATAWQPYMDEIFHIPQAQRYCAGDFVTQYDPKLTTPPGLYLLSYSLSKIGWPCDVFGLRLLNLVAGGLLLPLAIAFASTTRRGDLSQSIHLASMPIFAFFSLVYYTDVLSVVFVLLTFGFARRNRSVAAASVR